MQLMKGMLAVCLIVCTAGVAAAQSAVPDTMENRRAFAERYFAVSYPVIMRDFDKAVTNMMPPGPQRENTRKLFQKVLTTETMRKIAIPAMVKHFSAEELKALADFYSSPIGRSIQGKTSVYTAEVMPAIMKMAIQELQKQ